MGGLAENGGTWLVPGGADPLDLEEVRVDKGHKAAIAQTDSFMLQNL